MSDPGIHVAALMVAGILRPFSDRINELLVPSVSSIKPTILTSKKRK